MKKRITMKRNFLILIFILIPWVAFCENRATDSEPVDWITILAIVGPVGGVIIGAVGQWLMQWFSMQYSDKTRFHQLRVDVYSKYLHTANMIILGFLEGRRDDTDLDNVVYLGGQIALIASDEIRTHMVNINNTIMAVSDNLDTVIQHRATYDNHTQNFIEAARRELIVKR